MMGEPPLICRNCGELRPGQVEHREDPYFGAYCKDCQAAFEAKAAGENHPLHKCTVCGKLSKGALHHPEGVAHNPSWKERVCQCCHDVLHHIAEPKLKPFFKTVPQLRLACLEFVKNMPKRAGV
jgi:hypothetical protein